MCADTPLSLRRSGVLHRLAQLGFYLIDQSQHGQIRAADEQRLRLRPVDLPSETEDFLARDGVDIGATVTAEPDDVATHATAKRERKGCDWIVANDVRPETGIMGGSENAVTLVTANGAEPWPRGPKAEVARRLAERIAAHLSGEGIA